MLYNVQQITFSEIFHFLQCSINSCRLKVQKFQNDLVNLLFAWSYQLLHSCFTEWIKMVEYLLAKAYFHRTSVNRSEYNHQTP